MTGRFTLTAFPGRFYTEADIIGCKEVDAHFKSSRLLNREVSEGCTDIAVWTKYGLGESYRSVLESGGCTPCSGC